MLDKTRDGCARAARHDVLDRDGALLRGVVVEGQAQLVSELRSALLKALPGAPPTWPASPSIASIG